MSDKQKIMGAKAWLPLDNASKIFLSTMTSADTKVFRLTASLTEAVRPDILQKALERTYEHFPLYRAIIRRGIFWYFMEDTALTPLASEEDDILCAQIYHSTHRGLLFRILYRHNRIHLEVFHSLSDGSGAMSFFQLLLIAYFYYLDEGTDAPRHKVFPAYTRAELNQDAFRLYNFKEQIAQNEEHQAEPIDEKTKKTKVLHIRGKLTPDARQNVLEVHFRTSHILNRARELGGTITTYLASTFALALYRSSRDKDKRKPLEVALSCPVDLRQHFPNLSARNFFATLMLRYTFLPDHEPSIEELTTHFTKQLKRASAKENISKKVAKLVRFEKILLIRLVPLHIKDFVLRMINIGNNRSITAALTNLGRFRMPEGVKDLVEEVQITTSAVRPQMSIISYEKDLCISFTSPLESSEVQDQCLKVLIEDGLESTFIVESKSERGSAGEIIEKTDDRASALNTPYPYVPIGSNFSLAKFILGLGSILLLLLYASVSMFIPIQTPLSAVLLLIATVWLVTSGILRNRHNPSWMILLQSMSLGAGIIGIDFLLGFRAWSISWGLPAIFSGAILASEIVLLALPRAKNNGLYFHLLSILIGLIPILFLLFGWVHPIWPSIICVLIALQSLLFNTLFRRRQLLAEGRRKWHL